MMQAIYLAQYFLGQYQWVFAQQTTEGEGLTGIFAQVQTFATRHNGVITARDVKQMVTGIKKSSKATASFIRTIFSQLASAGYGMVQGSGIHLTYKALQDWGQQNLQNLLSLPKPLLPEDLSLDKNVDNANLQKATSTKESWVPVKILLGDQYLETGQGRYMETGDFEVLLDKGLKVLIAPEQQHRIQQYHVQENEENVDVGRFVAPLANTVKSIQAEAPNENVDLLASTAIRTETEPQPAVIATSTPVDQAPIDELIPWHTFPLAEVKQETEVSPTPQAIAHEVRSQLLICQSPHHFHQLIAQFGQTIIDWVTEHLLSTQKRIFLTQHLA
jgi:hypothetical protein